MTDDRNGREELDRAASGRTVCSSVLERLRSTGDVTALRERTPDGWISCTYDELGGLIARVAAGLRDLGLRRGERVVLFLANRIAFHVADLGVLFAGGTPVSVYPTSTAAQVAYVAEGCQATLAIVDGPAQAALLRQVADRLPRLRQVVVVDAPPAGAVAWTSVLAAGPLDLEDAADAVGPGDLATVIYTSGTTGPPKGVMLTHRNVVWTLESQRRAFGQHPLGFRTVSYLPMAHIAERMVSHYEALSSGYEISTCPTMAELGSYLVDVRPQYLFGVPRVWEKSKVAVEAALASEEGRADAFAEGVAAALPLRLTALDRPLSSDEQATLDFLDEIAFRPVRERLGLDACELLFTSGGPTPLPVLEWFLAVGLPLIEVYGLSELTGPLTANLERRPGSAGRPMPGCEIKLAPDGEVLARGGNVFAGYLDDPERTAETFDPDGWLRTGDIGVIDTQGRLRIVDRKKELFKTIGGEYLSPANLETALRAVPLVGQACVVGDGRLYPAALLVLDPDQTREWAAARGRVDMTLAAMAADPALRSQVEAGVDAAMAPFSQAERVKRVAILGDEWHPDSDVLTATLKLKRRGILAAYASEIEALYRP